MNYEQDLKEKILPFWLNFALDRKNGGIFTSLDRKGEIYGREKSVWFQGRALWSFSKAYNLIEQRAEYLEAANLIYRFLLKCEDTDGRMFFTVTENGMGIQKRRYYFSETFAAIGCAEYYRASGLIEALVNARKFFDVAYDCFTGKRKTEPKFNPEAQKLKALSPVMIMLSTAQVMRSVDAENAERYSKIASSCLDEILDGGFLTDKGLFECVQTDGKISYTPSGRVINPGHSMEAAWFIMLEGLLTKNERAIEVGKQIIDLSLKVGLDKERGGILAFVDADGKPPVQLEWDMKLWWPQCEALIALRLAAKLFKSDKYESDYNALKSYCEKYFIDNECGEWYGYLHYDNTPSTTLKGNIFKGPFHIPRLYIIMALLDETGNMDKFLN